MARAQVSYMVPVQAVVDLETDEVVRVVIIDESITLDATLGAMDTEFADTLSEDEKAKAIRIAENSEWPAWERGL